MAKDVIIALDFPTKEETLHFLDQFPAGEKPFVKIGMELFYAEGPDVVREIKARGHKIFLLWFFVIVKFLQRFRHVLEEERRIVQLTQKFEDPKIRKHHQI